MVMSADIKLQFHIDSVTHTLLCDSLTNMTEKCHLSDEDDNSVICCHSYIVQEQHSMPKD